MGNSMRLWTKAPRVFSPKMASAHFFEIEPLARFSGVSAGIRRPKVYHYRAVILSRKLIRHIQEITCFSYDDEHRYRFDDSSLRYYYPPSLPADLNHGFKTFRQLDDSKDDHLDGLVDTLALYEKEKGAKAEADIITWRGMMTKVCTS
jgi:RAT1-interacting protein